MTRPHLDDMELTGPMADRSYPDGRRRLQLGQRERMDLARHARAEAAVSLFLNLNRRWTWREMAEELNLSVSGLKDLTKSQEFQEIYNAHFAELGKDPRLAAVQAAVVEMLPLALQEMEHILTSPNAPASAKVTLIRDIFKTAGIVTPDKGGSERSDLAKFLREHGMAINNQTNVQVNNAYADAEAMLIDPEDIVDGEFMEMPDQPPEIESGDVTPVMEEAPEPT